MRDTIEERSVVKFHVTDRGAFLITRQESGTFRWVCYQQAEDGTYCWADSTSAEFETVDAATADADNY